MKSFVILALLCFVMLAPSTSIGQDRNEEDAIRKTFAEYLHASTWKESRKWMTDGAWTDYTMDILYSNWAEAESTIEDLGLKDYRLPKLPDDYRVLPKKDAIEEARRIQAEAYKDLTEKLGTKYLTLIEQLSRKGKDSSLNPVFSEFQFIDDETARADLKVDGLQVLIPMKFKKIDGKWLFDGKDEVLFFNRQR